MHDTDPTAPVGHHATSAMGVEPLPEVGFGIRRKLIALMVGTIVGIVVVLASYFATKQISELRAGQRGRAEVYAALAGQQLESAIAFSDEETAREVLAAIANDPHIIGVALYTDRGMLLHREGTPSDLSHASRWGLGGRMRAFYLPGRVLAVAPVQSLEGPRGTVVLEVSTRSVLEARRRLMRAAVVVGFTATMLGMLAAWLIANSIATRIERIASVASAMAGGDLLQTVDVRGPSDEIGVLARGFNTMTKAMRDLIDHVQRTAREEGTRLEHLVAERTAELDRKNRSLRLVLDNVEQGFVTVDRDGLVSGEYSRVIEKWLGESLAGQMLWARLDDRMPDMLECFQGAWSQVVSGFLPLEVTLDQMPTRVLLDERYLSFEYKPLGEDDFEKLIVVISDVTVSLARERKEQEERDIISVSSRLLRDRNGFVEFFTEAQNLVERVHDNRSDVIGLKRDLHTLKGVSAIYGVRGISQICHDLESTLEISDPAALDRSELVRRWGYLREKFEQFFQGRRSPSIEVDELEYEAVMEAIRQRAEHSAIGRVLGAWRLEPLRLRLERVGEQLSATAQRLGKGEVHVSTHAPHLYIAREELTDFWTAFSHVVRNAVSHGIERPETRRREGKSDVAHFDLCAHLEQGRLSIEIADTGPGIDWEVVRSLAKARGLAYATVVDLHDALFTDGFSTASETTDAAGRGVGLSVVRAVCERTGGTIEVSTERGKGTRFRFSWPATQFQSLTLLDVDVRQAAE